MSTTNQAIPHYRCVDYAGPMSLRVGTPRSKTIIKGKGKAVSLKAWRGPEVSRKLRFPDFVTTAQDGGRL